MYKKRLKYIKLLFASGLLFSFCGCNLNLGGSNNSSSTPAPAITYSPIPFPTTYIRSTSAITFNLSKTVASLNDEMFRDFMNFFEESATALDSRITLVQQNSYNSNVVLDLSQLNIPTTLSSSRLSFGTINIQTIKDQDLNVCGGSACQSAYFKFYTTGQNGAGFWDNTAQMSAPIYINKSVVGNGETNGTIAQEQSINLTTTSLSNSNLSLLPSYLMEADFSNLPVGTYQTTLMLEYGLSPNPVDISSTPTVVLTSFNGGQILQGGSQQTITWSATDSNFYYQPIKLEYSADAGTTWTLISQSTSNTGSFAWTVPSIDSNQVILRVSAFDIDSNVATAQSLSPFIIDSTAPVLATTGITQNEIIAGQSVIPINWTATDINFGSNPISLDYSLDGGNSWISIIAATTNFAPYFWTVPAINSLTAEVRVTATDLAGNISQALSPLFSIDNTPPIVTLASISGILTGGASTTIFWTATSSVFSSNPISLKYSTNNGTSWISIANSLANTGSYSWTVPLVDTSTAKIQITAIDEAGHSTSATSALSFIIDSTNPVVNLTTVNGGLNPPFVRASTATTITWTASDTNLGSSPISIDYSTTSGASWVNIVSGLANSGSYIWNVPGLQSGTAEIRVSATDLAGHTTSSVSPQTFVITEGIPNTMSIVSGNLQNIPRTVITTLPLIVHVYDAFGFSVPANVAVTFSVLTGGGSTTISVNTDINGNAQSFYTGGAIIGTSTIQASALKADSTTTSQTFSENVLSYAPTSVTATVTGLPEYVQFNSALTGFTPSGTGKISTSGIVSLSAATPFSASILTQSTSNIPNSSASGGIASSNNLASGSDIISVSLSATYPSGITGGTCSVAADSITNFDSLSCSLTGTNAITFSRNQIDNGVLDLDVLSSGAGSLDFLGINPKITVKRDSIKPVTNTNSSGSDGISLKPIVFSGAIYFPANNSSGVSKLFSYNPSTSALTQISNIKNDQTQSDNITSMALYNGSLFFIAEITTGVNKLFELSSTGTLTQISNLAGTGISDNLLNLTVYNTSLYFAAGTSSKLYSFCETGGGCAPLGFAQVSNINNGSPDGLGNMLAYNGLLYFSATETYTKLFTYCDGTGCGTQGIAQLTNISATNDAPSNFIIYNGILYFSEQTSAGKTKLFSYSSSTSTLSQVSNINNGGDDGISAVTTYGGNLFFVANQSAGVSKLYKYNDQTTLITQISNLNASGSDLIGGSFATYNNGLYFNGSDSSGYQKMYRFDGTTINQITNMIPGGADSENKFLTVGSLLYFNGITSGSISKMYQYCDPGASCTP